MSSDSPSLLVTVSVSICLAEEGPKIKVQMFLIKAEYYLVQCDTS